MEGGVLVKYSIGLDLEDLSCIPGCALGLLGDFGQVTSLLCASVSPDVKWW